MTQPRAEGQHDPAPALILSGLAVVVAAALIVWAALRAAFLLSGHSTHAGLADTVKAMWHGHGNPIGSFPASDRPPVGLWWTCLATLALLVMVVLVAAVVWWTGRRPRRQATRAARVQRGRSLESERSSRWASRGEISDLADDGDALRWHLGSLGKTSVAAGRLESLLVLAPTGAGKTARVTVPAVLRLREHRVPTVVASIKTDVVQLTYAAAARSGPVWTFAPGGAGVPGCRWNFLPGCEDLATARQWAGWLAESQRVEDRGRDDIKFWNELGRKLLTPLLFCAARYHLSMSEVLRWIEYGREADVTRLLDQLGADAAHAGPDVADAHGMWAATCARDPRTKGSVFGTAEVILAGFDDPDVRAIMTGTASEPDVYTPAKLLDSGGTLYLATTKSKADQLSCVFDALIAELLHEVETRSNTTGRPLPDGLALVLEEAANIARVRSLGYVASGMRGMGVQLMSVWQDEGQIENTYGTAAARSIVTNHRWKLYLPGTDDTRTLENLSGRIGSYLREDTSSSSDHTGRDSTSTRWVEQTTAAVADLQQLPADQAIAVRGGRKPIRLTAPPPWFTNPADRARMDPAVAAQFDHAFTAPAPGRRRA